MSEMNERWNAVHQLRDDKDYNPLLGDVDSILQENQRLVYKVANKAVRRTSARAEMEELIQEGMLGLFKAYRDYDGRTAFSTTAYIYINNEIRLFLRNKTSLIHIPAHIYELTGIILQNKWEEQTPKFIANNTKWTEKSAEYALHYLKNRNLASLNKPNRKSDRQNGEVIDLFQDDFDFTGPVVKDFMNTLADKERTTLKHLVEGCTYSDVGSILGVSRAAVGKYVKQIRKKAIRYFELLEEQEVSK
ncbi:RNA polymerase sigma factor [Paenibacillus phage PG1]|uniref:RNA polymerase sigma factor n=1 Tax=Paenibacillus phage PG1 TaxID=754053 RepID=UPI0003427ED0|nr:RNA polymerase sigma factor [Paenibacillus phage PG1]AGN33760.1 RNA polymerase sigma factor [Paenibacillus phage PG1]